MLKRKPSLKKRAASPLSSLPTEESAQYDELHFTPAYISLAVEQSMKQNFNKIFHFLDVNIIEGLERDQLADHIISVYKRNKQEIGVRLTTQEESIFIERMMDEVLGYGPIQKLLNDPEITEILVNGPDLVYIEIQGRLYRTAIQFRDETHLYNIVHRLVTDVGRRADEHSPLCDARMTTGARLNVVLPPLSLNGPCISIRKFYGSTTNIEKLIEFGSITPAMTSYLETMVQIKKNILIIGGTGSGKTTLLNALSGFIPNRERIVTIENAAELKLQQPHVVTLETRPVNLEGKGEVDERMLLKNALRMRPDRIILGEVRGNEAFEMLQAMNTGHDGSLGTLHASDISEAAMRLTNMVLLTGFELNPTGILNEIAQTIDVIVHVHRYQDGKRRVKSIVEVSGRTDSNLLFNEMFNFREETASMTKVEGYFETMGNDSLFIEDAEVYGLEQQLKASVSQ